MLFLTIPAKNFLFIKKTIEQYEALVDGFEIRWDYATKIDAQSVRNLTSRLLIFTFRTHSQGGSGSGVSWDVLESLAKARPDYLDLEYNFPLQWFRQIKQDFPHVQLIGSFHDFEKVPLNTPRMPGVDIEKYAYFCNSSLDAMKVLMAAKSFKTKFILIPMGEKASFGRIVAKALGSVMSFAALPGESTAPGQLTIEEMNDIYHFRSIDQNTSFYALLGHPIEHSIGHLFHNQFFREHHKNSCYVKIDVYEHELEDFLEKSLHLPFKGMSITMPLKSKAYTLSIPQDGFQSVNTLLRYQQQWLGYNTDIPAIFHVLNPIKYSSVLILGAGAMGVTLYTEFQKKDIKVFIFNRSPHRMASVLGFDHEFPATDLIINTLPEITPLLQKKILSNRHTWHQALDIVYGRQDFSQLMHFKGIPLITGLDIFYHQAKLQQEIWEFSGK